MSFNKMLVAAHRGDCYNYYENTMTAFEAAVNENVDMIETDVHLTKDDVLILMHDDKIDRTTDKTGYIKDMTYDEVCTLNAGDKYNPEKVPLVEQLLELASKNDIMLNIEIKEYYSIENKQRCEKCVDDVIALAEKYNMGEKILINSFDAYVLEYVYKKHGKKYKLHGFYPYSIMGNVKINPDDYLYCACVFDDMNKANYDYLISKNIQPWIGAGVTQQGRLRICLEYGARLITTNNPADTIQKLERI